MDHIALTANRRFSHVMFLNGIPGVLLVICAFISWERGVRYDSLILFVAASLFLIIGVALFAIGQVRSIKIDRWEAQQRAVSPTV